MSLATVSASREQVCRVIRQYLADPDRRIGHVLFDAMDSEGADDNLPYIIDAYKRSLNSKVRFIVHYSWTIEPVNDSSAKITFAIKPTADMFHDFWGSLAVLAVVTSFFVYFLYRLGFGEIALATVGGLFLVLLVKCTVLERDVVEEEEAFFSALRKSFTTTVVRTADSRFVFPWLARGMLPRRKLR